MTEDRLRQAIADHPVPDQQGAEERAWRVIRAAYAEEDHLRPQRVVGRRVLQVAIVLGLLAALISPAGAQVRHWVGDAIDSGRQPSRPALTSLPTSGRLLVDSTRGPWVVQPDGSKRLLGDFRQSTWSPHGLFIAATTRHQLLAVDPAGDVRWSLARSGPVGDPSWAPDGFRIAYLSGDSMRVVAGDGSGDHLLARRVAPVTPAWRPGVQHVLAFATNEGSVEAVAADSGRVVFRTRPGGPPTGLAWSSDGSRLLVVQRSAVKVLDANAKLLWRQAAPGGTGIRTAVPSPTSKEVALIASSKAGVPRSELVLVGPGGAERQLFAGPGRFSDVAWSPDGKWLLLAWPSADQWLFLRVGRPQRIVAVSDISSQFAPGTTGSVQFPKLAGWCCQKLAGEP